jgi:hypothetical protein
VEVAYEAIFDDFFDFDLPYGMELHSTGCSGMYRSERIIEQYGSA